MSESSPGWPARLDYGPITLRPLRTADADDWRRVRGVNRDWLQPWDATMPPGSGGKPVTFPQLVRRLRQQARRGQTLPFVIEVHGRFAGQITVSNVVRGSAQFASIGYWLDQRWAGQGVMPVAVALVIDHCFASVGLHRIEIAVRPENSNSLRVVEKLGIHEVGYAPRYLHIDGNWCDHRLFAVTAEECPGGMLNRVLAAREA
ncbi:MAG: GNAT family protein [Nocardioides sp.]